MWDILECSQVHPFVHAEALRAHIASLSNDAANMLGWHVLFLDFHKAVLLLGREAFLVALSPCLCSRCQDLLA